MAVKLQDITDSRIVVKPKALITTEQLFEEREVVNSLDEITNLILKIDETQKREYAQEEERLNEQRAIIMEGLAGNLKHLQRGSKAGSFEHIKASTQIYELMMDLWGLKKPVNKKPEQKVIRNIKLEFRKSRDT